MDEGHDAFIIKELDKYDLSDRASLIRYVHLLFYALRGVPVDDGSLLQEQHLPSSSSTWTWKGPVDEHDPSHLADN